MALFVKDPDLHHLLGLYPVSERHGYWSYFSLQPVLTPADSSGWPHTSYTGRVTLGIKTGTGSAAR